MVYSLVPVGTGVAFWKSIFGWKHRGVATFATPLRVGTVTSARCSRPRKLAPLRLLEACVLAFCFQLAQQGRVQGGRWRLAAGTGPVALLGHDLDELGAAHGLFGFLQDLDRRIQGAELLRGRGGGSLLGAQKF